MPFSTVDPVLLGLIEGAVVAMLLVIGVAVISFGCRVVHDWWVARG